ncbi:Relaxin receptor 1 [Liparis tanakae]|uniref:Relaxin receptor 1 n=1 Tax=Liparis tanakae TaxID=230148 RepID=A0A4Z2FM95_9TELE|nr:Relaxin receptor 1 [Liparis tanakae]
MRASLTHAAFARMLGAIPELCQCRDLELDCDGAQLQDIPVVAVNVTMIVEQVLASGGEAIPTNRIVNPLDPLDRVQVFQLFQNMYMCICMHVEKTV